MLFSFPAQDEYSYFSADFRLKILLIYSYIIAYDISVLEFIGAESVTSVWYLDSIAFRCSQRSLISLKKACRTEMMETKVPDFVSIMSRTIECDH